MTVRTATELVVLIENTLGWTPEPTEAMPLWKLRRIEAGKINRKIKTNPTLFTWENLELAVAYLYKKRRPVKAPLGIFTVVADAVEVAAEKPLPAESTSQLIANAIKRELREEKPGYEVWVGRLTRAFGNYRRGIYDAWVRERT